MKNNFALSMSLLLLLTGAGSWLAFRKATHHEEKPAAHAEATAPAAGTPSTETAPAEGAATAGTTEGGTTPAGTTNNAGTPGVDNTNATGATGNAPEDTAAAANASAPAGNAEEGKTKFAGTCAGCHGANAEGGVGPALAATKTWTDAQFMTALREGRSPEKNLSAVMPHFTSAQVTDAEVAGIHAYLKTLN